MFTKPAVLRCEIYFSRQEKKPPYHSSGNIPTGKKPLGFGNVGLNSAKALYDNGAKIIGIAEKEGGIFNKKGINIYQLEEYQNQKNTILNLIIIVDTSLVEHRNLPHF